MRDSRYRKFELARQRVSQETDITRLIKLNRVTKVLLKMNFNSQQRRAINFSKKYVIASNHQKKRDSEDEKKKTAKVQQLVERWNLEGEENDRRIYYEVTGERLRLEDFLDKESDTSGFEDVPDDAESSDLASDIG